MDALSLEQRIADALCSEMPSAKVEALIGEAEASVAAAEEAAAEARARALDPTVLDPSARIAAADAEFTRDRLRAALPKLRTRLAKLQRAEAYARWVVDYDRVRPLRDALAEELRALYPDFVARLTDLLRRIQ
jgi:hypothetical protein